MGIYWLHSLNFFKFFFHIFLTSGTWLVKNGLWQIGNAKFNWPWSNNVHYIVFHTIADDAVYLEDDEERKEYVLNETGLIFKREYWSHKGKRWTYGQVKQ